MSARILYFVLVLLFAIFLVTHSSSESNSLVVPLQKDECWWGAVVDDGYVQPFTKQSKYSHNLNGSNKSNQIQPFLLSNQGRYVWSEKPFEFSFENGVLTLTSKFETIKVVKAGNNLREAFVQASREHFSASGMIPAEMMFKRPQYNTWIELTYNQNQNDILKYASNIINNAFPPGVLIVDDTWQHDYGAWRFNAERFNNPGLMVDELHQLGFKVMLWVCPFVSADSREFRKLRDMGLLVRNAADDGEAIISWWNGYSSVLDMTNPKSIEWFKKQLSQLQDEYSIEGFKFDGGDAIYYTGGLHSFLSTNPNDQMEAWARLGLEFPYNEYRACWKLGGQQLVQRLHDKNHNWEDLRLIIPNTIVQGLVGYAYTCPDMIGGGEYQSFRFLKDVDQELVVRSAQCQALMPMMQFSVAPWRVLNNKNSKICCDMARLHTKFGDYIIKLAKESSITGEPIVRSLEYQYPGNGYAHIVDQFLLGEDILVAPVLELGARSRQVQFPPGTWKDEEGQTFVGPSVITVNAPIEKLPWFRRVSE